MQEQNGMGPQRTREGSGGGCEAQAGCEASRRHRLRLNGSKIPLEEFPCPSDDVARTAQSTCHGSSSTEADAKRAEPPAPNLPLLRSL